MTSVFDKTAEEMLEKISEFSMLNGHGSLVALAIMSHGFKVKEMCKEREHHVLHGDIAGYLHKTSCSVEQVTESFCQPLPESTIKVKCS